HFLFFMFFFFSSRRRHTRSKRDWSSDVCSSDLACSTCLIFSDSIAVSSIVRRYRSNFLPATKCARLQSILSILYGSVPFSVDMYAFLTPKFSRSSSDILFIPLGYEIYSTLAFILPSINFIDFE